MALGRELGGTGKGVRALGDLGGGAELWEGRLQPRFLLCPPWSRGCSGPAVARDGVGASAWARPPGGGLTPPPPRRGA